MADWHSIQKQATSGGSDSSTSSPPLRFTSRRSPVLCRNGCVASSQPLASSIGLQILRQKNGNAIDAAIAVAAALAILEPCSTGLGGDMFALIYSAKDQTVEAVNGSGRSPSGLTLDVIRRDCSSSSPKKEDESNVTEKFKHSPHSVTVPGAAKGWEDMLLKYGSGKLTFSELLQPSIELATEGFPVTPITSHHWQSGMSHIQQWYTSPSQYPTIPLSINGRGPFPGEIFRNPHLASVLQSLGQYGSINGFYDAFPGHAIVDAIQMHGGVMTREDLINHQTTFPDAISVEYRNVKLWQVPPNGQGIAGLIALKGLSILETEQKCDAMTPQSICQQSAEVYHPMMEMMRLGFGDARAYVADMDVVATSSSDCGGKSIEWLLDERRIGDRAMGLFDKNKAVVQGLPSPTSCTVSFQVVDKEGNAVSFVNSNFMGFGTGIIPENCGFTLQNRGFGFSLDPSHPNVVAPNKRPYHTIIPGMLTYADTDELYATISNMGGYMQPQGHFQLTVGLVAGELDPQTAIDMPRFCIADGTQNGTIFMEDGFSKEMVRSLKEKGHDLNYPITNHDRSVFGRAQIIKRDRDTGVYWAGSDGRADGCAMGY